MENLYYMVFTTSLFILVFLLLRTAVRNKTSMRLQYALWLLVAVKLLVFPVPQMESFLSVWQLSGIWEDRQQEFQGKAAEAAGVLQTRPQKESAAGNGHRELQVQPSAEGQLDGEKDSAGMNLTPEDGSFQKRSGKSTHGDSAEKNMYRICAGVAAAGSLFLFLCFLLENLRFAVCLHKRRSRLKQDFPLPVYLVKGLPSPCLYGKAVYLSPEMAGDEKKRLHMLTHEYCHYRQGDLCWSVLRCLCVICCWWNPLVWLCACLSKQDCELSCDELALKRLGENERISYGRTLLGLVPVKARTKDYFSVATTMTGGGKIMKRRIQKIANKSKPATPVCILAVLTAAVCLVSVSTLKPETVQTVLQPAGSTVSSEPVFKEIPETGKLSLKLVNSDDGKIKKENNFSVSAEYRDGNIVLTENEGDTKLVSIGEKYDEGGLFLSMKDENSGYLLYCSTPAGGQMMKLLYSTDDRWKTYSETDISSRIDGYPTSLSALRDGKMYIGAQMHSNGYMFESTDSGKNWNPVFINENSDQCRNGYAPLLDREKGISYVLLESDGIFSLYRSDEKMSEWKLSGVFLLENGIQEYFISGDMVVITDLLGNWYQLLDGEEEAAVTDLDEAVGKAVLSHNADSYGALALECVAEGHILLGKEVKNAETTVYALTMYGEYGFENGGFIKGSGTGTIPTVIVFSHDEENGYVLEDFRYPMDGGYYISSIHELFPEKYWERCINRNEADDEELTRQERVYAAGYLKQIGRDAGIGEYPNGDYPLLTDEGVSVEVSNHMGELEKLYGYPYWTGNLEKLEGGVRYLYEMDLDKDKGEIIYTKRVYDTGEVTERFRFDMKTGEEIKQVTVQP